MAELEITTTGLNVERFFGLLRHTKGVMAGKPFVLEQWQRDFLREFFRVDPVTGRRLYKIGVFGVPRGNGKSPLAAGLGLFELLSKSDAPEVYAAAGAKDQAQIVQDFARSFVDTGGLKEHGLEAFKRTIVSSRNAGVMKVIASAGLLQHGLNPSAAIVDELHAFMQEDQEEMWTALISALHKRPHSYALTITTAGYDKNTILGRLYDEMLGYPGEDRLGGCLRIRRDLENGRLFWWYGIPEALEQEWENEELWKLVNPGSWLDFQELRKLRYTLDDELDFKRLILNMWTASRDSWLPSGVWTGLGPKIDEASGQARPLRIPKGADVYLGVDVGWYHDSTAVVWASRVGERIVLRAKIWTTLDDQEGEFVPGGKMRLALVETFILERLRKRFRIREVAFDPDYFGRSAELLEARGMTPVEMDPASAQTLDAWNGFFQGACEGLISHNGDPAFAKHVAAAATRQTLHGPRVTKLNSTSRIDALAAAVLAFNRCEVKTRPTVAKPRVWWMTMDGEPPKPPKDEPPR